MPFGFDPKFEKYPKIATISVNPIGESMNVCCLSGRLTRRPELRYQASGKPELTLSLTIPNGERDGTQFYLPYDVTVYGQDCEPLAESLDEGDLVELTGQNTRPKLPAKPGMKPIPAAICFHVTRLSAAAATEHERSPEYGHEVEVASPTETPEPRTEPPSKSRRPRVPKIAQRPWVPTEFSEN
jgi:single-stranded DNA-binding protein